MLSRTLFTGLLLLNISVHHVGLVGINYTQPEAHASTLLSIQMNSHKMDSLPEFTETPTTIEALPASLRNTIIRQKATGESVWSEIKCGSKVIYHQFTEISGVSKKYNAKGELLWTALHCYQPQCYNRMMRKLAHAAMDKPNIIVEDASRKYKYRGYTLVSGSIPREGEEGNFKEVFCDAHGKTISSPPITLLNIIFNDTLNFN